MQKELFLVSSVDSIIRLTSFGVSGSDRQGLVGRLMQSYTTCTRNVIAARVHNDNSCILGSAVSYSLAHVKSYLLRVICWFEDIYEIKYSVVIHKTQQLKCSVKKCSCSLFIQFAFVCSFQCIDAFLFK